jgi:iron complex transport system substrate-binding protein
MVFAYELDDVNAAMGAIARALGYEERARALTRQLDAEIAAVRAAVSGLPQPRVLFLYGHRPLVAAGAGCYADALLEIAGGVNVAAKGSTRYPTLSVETVIGYAPDVILDAYSAGMGGEQQDSALQRFDAIPAVRAGRVHQLSDNAALRPGPRAGQDARLIARLLHPDIRI